MKIFLTVIITCLIISILFLGAILGVMYVLKDDKDFCLDSGICIQGQIINTEYEKVEINEQNCLKYNWIWNEKQKYCKLK